MKTIAVIDDDIYIGNMLEEVLINEGYRVLRAYSGTEAVLLLSTQTPDLVLLDLMLPGMDGEQVLSHIQGIPVIILSAKAEVDDKVRLLLVGAADYVTKPFQVKELLARITVQLRLHPKASSENSSISFGQIVLSPDTHNVTVQGRSVRLTRTEFAILKKLMQNPRQVITKTQLLDEISEDTPDCMESSLKVHISNLRRKLREADGKDHIESVWGIGFKMREEPIFPIS
ncbi:Mycobacterial persistence regulator A [uncultured Ruminococcus sp.]|uniref:Stage 0 sporulation protein A homolog n=1 Tax=Massiliimalia timonensis TaxID=1987501 RepID=A0A8J6TYE0_9FIRM|nr:response regulator transcription factor [Massiliimalia timonensis]MBC8609702.1 response regulator transcription factor [Massiliimalia timonensis]MBS7175146.1 response regulator transcription factor [Clostridiales bacterium]SCH29918.1 Mycobacterial persistence regulator A [uncultured Ruminococcus sp.]SCH33689.1 Mycobacterial persistence regulator A [uncultured Clostridium sp.]